MLAGLEPQNGCLPAALNPKGGVGKLGNAYSAMPLRGILCGFCVGFSAIFCRDLGTGSEMCCGILCCRSCAEFSRSGRCRDICRILSRWGARRFGEVNRWLWRFSSNVRYPLMFTRRAFDALQLRAAKSAAITTTSSDTLLLQSATQVFMGPCGWVVQSSTD